MAKYSALLQRTASASASVGTLTAPASSMRRAKIYDFTLGSEAVPADVANLWRLSRCTAPGTNTAVTPSPLDTADAACVTVAGQANSVEPTYTSSGAIVLADTPLNQKATYRWIASPGGELVIPATASNGFGLLTPTAGSSSNMTAFYYFEEQ
jgi:hypothetical protein